MFLISSVNHTHMCALKHNYDKAHIKLSLGAIKCLLFGTLSN